MTSAHLRIAMLSRPGGRERNEDACGHWGLGRSGLDGPVCCVLADGAGGHGGGDVASRTAASAVLESFAARPICSPAVVRSLIDTANRAVVARQSASDATRDMRSTLVVWLCDPASRQCAWGHTGDSRLYCFRDGGLLARTRDHSLLQSMVDAGMAHAGDPRGNPQRNVLFASLGSLEGFEADVPQALFTLAPGDAFLLCSDGFWESVRETEMEAGLQRAETPQDWIDDMASLVDREARIGQDNYSAVAVWFGDPDFRTRIGPVRE